MLLFCLSSKRREHGENNSQLQPQSTLVTSLPTHWSEQIVWPKLSPGHREMEYSHGKFGKSYCLCHRNRNRKLRAWGWKGTWQSGEMEQYEEDLSVEDQGPGHWREQLRQVASKWSRSVRMTLLLLKPSNQGGSRHRT